MIGRIDAITADNPDYVFVEGRRYPSRYPPGAHWATDEAWRILDMLKEGALPDDVRAFLAGGIAGALMRERALTEAKRS